MDWQRGELHRLIGPDLGIGDKELRRELNSLLCKGNSPIRVQAIAAYDS